MIDGSDILPAVASARRALMQIKVWDDEPDEIAPAGGTFDMNDGRACYLTLVAAVFCLSAISPAAAAGDAQAGHDLAQRWCTSCHIIDRSGHGPDTGPPFPTIVLKNKEDRSSVRAWLADPHPPMPNFNLSQPQIDDLAAYLDSLKAQ
jgi:mono/diheme cytochrome c family protein